jgi:hypothetical protein
MATEMSSVGSAGFWDLDEPLPRLAARARRAGIVGAVWGLSILPVATGMQGCAIAALFHRPCPGCGMTRAIRLLAAGRVDASLHMHPLAVPVLAVGVLLIVSTIWATLVLGSPIRVHRTRLGRFTFAAGAVVYGAAIVLWALRWFGYFGGPVPVF